MGSDQKVQAAVGQISQQLLAGGTFDASRQQPHAQPEGLGPNFERARVLLRQNLGRSHQRRLKSVVHGKQHRHECHEGLARPHISLNEAVHGASRPHVAADFAHHPLLGFGERKGQNFFVKLGQVRAYTGKTVSGPAAPLLQALVGKKQLVEKELFKREAVAGGSEGLGRLRVVHAAHSHLAAWPFLCFAQGFGHPVAAVAGWILEQRINFCRQPSAVQLHRPKSLRRRVHWGKARGRRRSGRGPLDLGVGYVQPVFKRVHAAKYYDLFAHRQALLDPTKSLEPHQFELVGAVHQSGG